MKNAKNKKRFTTPEEKEHQFTNRKQVLHSKNQGTSKMRDFPQANPKSLNPTQIFQGFEDSTKKPIFPVEKDQISLPKKKK